VPLLDQTILSVSMFDKFGRKFDNFSSMFVEWKSSDQSLGTLERVLDASAEDRTDYRRKISPVTETCHNDRSSVLNEPITAPDISVSDCCVLTL